MKSTRRTQAERTATTKSALLHATIACVVEHGYAKVTSAQIADRAGVTRGALAHHFTTKAELVMASLSFLTEQLVARFHESPPPQGTDHEKLITLLDYLWGLHTEPVFTAVTELLVASRTDPELRPRMAEFDRALFREFFTIACSASPGLAENPALPRFLTTAFAAMRGIALHRDVAGERSAAPLWAETREHLRTLLATL